MTNFLRDNTALPNGKTDLVALGGGDDPTKNLTAVEWNTTLQASLDLRAWVKTGLTPGSYTDVSLTVDADGRVTAASTGQAPANTIVGNNTGSTANKANLTAAQARVVIGGCYLGTQILTAASGTYTPTAGTSRAHVRMIPAGGGGGGAGGGANSAAGGGGGAGVLVEFWVGVAGTALTGGAFTNSTTGGAAGGNTGTAGGTGGDCTLVAAATTYTAKGATGGTGMVTSTAATALGGVGQAGSTTTGTSAVVFPPALGVRGGTGQVTAAAVSFAGGGASLPPYGTGGAAALQGADGGAATGFGAGGGGANATAAGKLGGVGAPSCIIIEEFS